MQLYLQKKGNLHENYHRLHIYIAFNVNAISKLIICPLSTYCCQEYICQKQAAIISLLNLWM